MPSLIGLPLRKIGYGGPCPKIVSVNIWVQALRESLTLKNDIGRAVGHLAANGKIDKIAYPQIDIKQSLSDADLQAWPVTPVNPATRCCLARASYITV